VNTRALLIVTALLEFGTGLALLTVPSLIAKLLLGDGLCSRQAMVVARVAGVALVSLGVACWLGRNGERVTKSCLAAGMLIYNLGVPILLLHAWIAWSLYGWGLWPATLLHAGLAVWSIMCLRRIR